MEEVRDYVSLEEVLSDLNVENVENEFISLENADVIAMACCNQTPASCWTQM